MVPFGFNTRLAAGQNVQIQSITAFDDNGPSAGVDQLFVPIPLSLRGSGEVDVVLSVDGPKLQHRAHQHPIACSETKHNAGSSCALHPFETRTEPLLF
jgi:hypothetical protein